MNFFFKKKGGGRLKLLRFFFFFFCNKKKKAFGQSTAGNDLRLLEGLPYEAGCALNCLSNICTPYLAETLLEDVYGMMNSSKPYIRKKAVLVLYPIFKRFPRALRLSFDRLKDKLKDEDPGVQNAAVNVICELARKNPPTIWHCCHNCLSCLIIATTTGC
ncbi:hypothetical protein RFI_18261 [Reticulomyxa filosa]|uniref:Clathrin/coatomer adaptor adaptin-like N-terminal domain-containing protein n=1 Tax=Reticulomyxa filosa TaxID=46433 RepID=X6MZA9_RETFI|nr:hypothetical protein RFI_18261 [Reticulomyxa filosa]|eukprot:ETO18973.1 hypothetical protein RFI_18261 [Reticulomyxa filosa]